MSKLLEGTSTVSGKEPKPLTLEEINKSIKILKDIEYQERMEKILRWRHDNQSIYDRQRLYTIYDRQRLYTTEI